MPQHRQIAWFSGHLVSLDSYRRYTDCVVQFTRVRARIAHLSNGYGCNGETKCR